MARALMDVSSAGMRRPAGKSAGRQARAGGEAPPRGGAEAPGGPGEKNPYGPRARPYRKPTQVGGY